MYIDRIQPFGIQAENIAATGVGAVTTPTLKMTPRGVSERWSEGGGGWGVGREEMRYYVSTSLESQTFLLRRTVPFTLLLFV